MFVFAGNYDSLRRRLSSIQDAATTNCMRVDRTENPLEAYRCAREYWPKIVVKIESGVIDVMSVQRRKNMSKLSVASQSFAHLDAT